MYTLYKYHEILNMEKELKDNFKDINPCSDIAILPPVIKHYKTGHVLAFLVIPDPEDNNNHMPVFRPIGAILRKLKSKKIVRIVNCAKEEFAPQHNDYSLEYYNLETNPEYWPNRTTDNEEKYRVALEKLLRIVQTMHLGVYKKKLYQEYIETIYSMFDPKYLYFYDAIINNPIETISDEMLYQRELAKKEHEIRMEKMRKKFMEDTSEARQKFLKKIKEHLQFFIRKEILPTLRNKAGYTKLDFYRFAGKMYKQILLNNEKYLNCYDATLTKKAIEANLDEVKEQLKISLIKTYAKACVNVGNTDGAINDVSNEIIRFMDTMLLQEVTNTVSQKSKENIKISMVKIERMLGRIQESPLKNEVKTIYEEIKNDYFNSITEKDMCDTYLGCMLTDIVI